MKKYVAEVWLEWPICRGSTMYRQKFRWKWQAIVAAKIRAVILDFYLPSYYPAEYSNGRKYSEAYDYGIYYGVRLLTNREQEKFNYILSTHLPGSKQYSGEHSVAHPLKDQIDGYRI